jgi:hypothetical protein
LPTLHIFYLSKRWLFVWGLCSSVVCVVYCHDCLSEVCVLQLSVWYIAMIVFLRFVFFSCLCGILPWLFVWGLCSSVVGVVYCHDCLSEVCVLQLSVWYIAMICKQICYYKKSYVSFNLLPTLHIFYLSKRRWSCR